MATAQKRGFRFPWEGDARHDEPPPDRDDDEAEDRGELTEGAGSAGNELGRGPFGLTGTAPAADVPPPEPLDADRATWPASDRRTRPAAEATEPVSLESPGGPDEDARPEAEPATAQEPEPEPTSEAHGAATAQPAPPQPTSPPSAADRATAPGGRRDNLLVTGLVRAMRDAARTARDETVAGLRAEASARAEGIRADSAVAVTELKKAAEADVVAIKDWSRAELARVREETEARISARRTQLVEETEAAGQAAEDLLARLGATIEAFEAEMGGFFDTLLAEDDPARLAGLAERMPSPPDLTSFPDRDEAPAPAAPARRGASEPAPATPQPTPEGPAAEGTPVADAAPPPDEEPVADASPVDTSPPDASLADGAFADGAFADGAFADGSFADDAGAQQSRLGWLDHLDPDAAAAAEAEALAGLDRQTNLIVSGLSSVAGIAALKGALVHVAGVSAVSVTAGSNGEVLFTVTHDGQTDLRDAVRSLDAFEPHLIADDGDTLSVAAREPAA